MEKKFQDAPLHPSFDITVYGSTFHAGSNDKFLRWPATRTQFSNRYHLVQLVSIVMYARMMTTMTMMLMILPHIALGNVHHAKGCRAKFFSSFISAVYGNRNLCTASRHSQQTDKQAKKARFSS